MTWRLTEINDPEKIQAIFSSIYNDTLPIEAYHARTDDSRIYIYQVKWLDDTPSGFAIFRCQGQESELWQAGVLSERRRQGAGTALLKQGEHFMAQFGYTRMTVKTFNRCNIMLSMLLRRGYRIHRTQHNDLQDDLEITLLRELKLRKEMRYALTEKCNFRCLFCHNEGLGHAERNVISDEQVFNLLQETVRLGHTDITLTGGEPLLKKKRLQFLLHRLGKLDDPPNVTIITNGSLLDQQVIEWLRDYPGNLKIHLSLHATDEATFKHITQTTTDGLFHKVVDNIRAASRAGLTVKVNHVVLQNLNHTKIADAVDLARSLGASAIKFLELLVLEGRENDYAMYYDLQAIQRQIEQFADGPHHLNARQFIYRHKADSQFMIEVTRCTCAIGCSHCSEMRDRTFSSDMSYHPCFVRHKKFYPVTQPEHVQNVLSKGDRIIDGYSVKFGDSSPTLILKEKFVTDKREFFFHVKDLSGFQKFLVNQGFALKNRYGFHLEYYWPASRSVEWERFERMLKIGWDYHDQSQVGLIYTDHRYIQHPVIGFETITQYLNGTGPMNFENAEIARHFLDRLDFEKYLEQEWNLQTWQGKDQALSLAIADQKSTVKVSGTIDNVFEFMDLAKKYNGTIEPLQKPLIEFMRESV